MLTPFESATQNDRDALLEFLFPDLGNCLYLYLDIDTFKIGGGTIDVWTQKNELGEYASVVMRYSDSFQLYALEKYIDLVDYNWIAAQAQSLVITRISGPSKMIKHLLSCGLGEFFDDSYGIIIELGHYRKMTDDSIVIEEAPKKDIPEIVRLILKDEMFGSSYTEESLIKQFEARLDEGMGASFIIRKDGRIIAHSGLSAISKDFIIASYMIVDPEYRDFPYGAFLDAYLANEWMPKHGKRGFGMLQEERRIKLFNMMGNPTVGEYGKLLRIQ